MSKPMNSKGLRTEPRESVKLKYSVQASGNIKRSATNIIAGAEKTHLMFRFIHRENLPDLFPSLSVTVATDDSFRSSDNHKVWNRGCTTVPDFMYRIVLLLVVEECLEFLLGFAKCGLYVSACNPNNDGISNDLSRFSN